MLNPAAVYPNSWDGVTAAARDAGSRWPSLVAAQWALESGWGKHAPGHNYFGQKGPGKTRTTGEVINGEAVVIEDSFKTFPSLAASVQFLVTRWYLDWNGHQGVNRAPSREAAADMLVAEGYCTDPDYAAKLRRLMAENAPFRSQNPAMLKSEIRTWRTRVRALKLSQPDAQSCQAACIAMAVGDPDIRGIRQRLTRLGSAGAPDVMAAVIRSYDNITYSFHEANLEQVIAWLKAGDLLITHGWFTGSGHVIVLDGLVEKPDGSLQFDVADPWSEFDAPRWAYTKSSKFFDGLYSERCIYAACVGGRSTSHAKELYSKGVVSRHEGGMWVHRFQPAAAPAEPSSVQTAQNPAPASQPAEQKPQVLYQIEAVQSTWLKKAPVQASDLQDDEKLAVHRGKVYDVLERVEIAGDAHAKVTLSYRAGSWYVFEPHWMRTMRTGEAVSAAAAIDWGDFGCLITPNLTVGEVVQWSAARVPREGSSTPIRVLAAAAQFQRIREAWGSPIGITSWLQLPNAINSTRESELQRELHCNGLAMDIYPIGRSIDAFHDWLINHWTGGLGDHRAHGYLHLDVIDNGRFVPGGGVRPLSR